jgi:threonyl-tRNA synthetase
MKIKITFPDGRVAEYDKGTTSMQIASSISEGLARNVLGAKVNGIVVDASRPIQEDSTVQLLTWNDKEGKSTFWHSSAHLMAEALEALHPGTKFGIGPAIENGFYYDIDTGDKILSANDFQKSNKRSLNWRDNPMSTSALKYQKQMR